MMELKQLAESITMIAYKKKLKDRGVKYKNRPLVWQERIENAENKVGKKSGIKRIEKR